MNECPIPIKEIYEEVPSICELFEEDCYYIDDENFSEWLELDKNEDISKNLLNKWWGMLSNAEKQDFLFEYLRELKVELLETKNKIDIIRVELKKVGKQ